MEKELIKFGCEVKGAPAAPCEFTREEKTAFEICGKDALLFTVGKGTVEWESAEYQFLIDKVRIQRISRNGGGKPFLMGLTVKTRYISPKQKVFVLK